MNLRETPVRRTLLDVLGEQKKPIDAVDLLHALSKKGLHPNKTTIYRQLEALITKGEVERIVVDPTVQMFELKRGHHHHFVCESCEEVLDLESEEETTLKKLEKTLKKRGFAPKKHELTFFGLCSSCH